MAGSFLRVVDGFNGYQFVVTRSERTVIDTDDVFVFGFVEAAVKNSLRLFGGLVGHKDVLVVVSAHLKQHGTFVGVGGGVVQHPVIVRVTV